jgi:hypothetical protein
MIIGMIKAHPTENRKARRLAPRVGPRGPVGAGHAAVNAAEPGRPGRGMSSYDLRAVRNGGEQRSDCGDCAWFGAMGCLSRSSRGSKLTGRQHPRALGAGA